MRARKDITFKLPDAFVGAHRAALEAVDWKVTPTAEIDLGWPQNPVLEAVAGRSTTIIRPATIKSANLIRKSVGSVEIDAADVARVLASRNPPEPE